MANVKQTIQNCSRALRSGKTDPDFFEFVRELEQELGPVGCSSNYLGEKVRFGQVPYLNFARTSMAEITEKQGLLRLFVYFMGLTTPTGPMPLEFTSFVFHRAHNDYDFALSRFLDIFNHRFIGLFYRAWKRCEQAASADTPDDDLVSIIINALSGGSCKHKKEGVQLERGTENNNADLMNAKCKSIIGLQTILRRQFQADITVEPHQLSRISIPEKYRSFAGKRGCAELGRNIQLGSHCWSRSQKIMIRTGVMSFSEAMEKIPMEEGVRNIGRIVCRYVDQPQECELELNIKRETLPDPKVNGTLQLGRFIWLAGKRTGEYPLRINLSNTIRKAHMDSYKNNKKGQTNG